MKNKILSIKEKVPQETTLADGVYMGTWGGYVIEVYHNKKTYELQTEVGIKGLGFKVVVNITDGIATFNSINN